MELRHCQICERDIKARTGVIAHHGYQRPGDGWQTASCFGARKLPYEESCDAIQPYIDTVKNYKSAREQFVKGLVENPPAELTAPRISMRYDEKPRVFARPENFDPNVNHHGNRYSSYEGNFDAQKSDAEYQIRNAIKEIERMEKRLQAWVKVI